MMHLPTRLRSEGLSLDGGPAVVTLSLSYITSGENYYGAGEGPGFFLSVSRVRPSLESRLLLVSAEAIAARYDRPFRMRDRVREGEGGGGEGDLC